MPDSFLKMLQYLRGLGVQGQLISAILRAGSGSLPGLWRGTDYEFLHLQGLCFPYRGDHKWERIRRTAGA